MKVNFISHLWLLRDRKAFSSYFLFFLLSSSLLNCCRSQAKIMLFKSITRAEVRVLALLKNARLRRALKVAHRVSSNCESCRVVLKTVLFPESSHFGYGGNAIVNLLQLQ